MVFWIDEILAPGPSGGPSGGPFGGPSGGPSGGPFGGPCGGPCGGVLEEASLYGDWAPAGWWGGSHVGLLQWRAFLLEGLERLLGNFEEWREDRVLISGGMLLVTVLAIAANSTAVLGLFALYTLHTLTRGRHSDHPEDGAPEDGAPEDGAPEGGAPEGGAPEDPEGGAPKGLSEGLSGRPLGGLSGRVRTLTGSSATYWLLVGYAAVLSGKVGMLLAAVIAAAHIDRGLRRWIERRHAETEHRDAVAEKAHSALLQSRSNHNPPELLCGQFRSYSPSFPLTWQAAARPLSLYGPLRPHSISTSGAGPSSRFSGRSGGRSGGGYSRGASRIDPFHRRRSFGSHASPYSYRLFPFPCNIGPHQYL